MHQSEPDPWAVAQASWKLLNVVFLIGSVLLTFQVFSHLYFTSTQRYLIWSYAFVLSPRVATLVRVAMRSPRCRQSVATDVLLGAHPPTDSPA
jgi:hypothetical protein